MMIKAIESDAWGRDYTPRLQQVKIAGSGLRGHDLTTFLKVASHPLATWVRSNPPKPGELYVHLVAMGATEKVGPNRNADGYRDAMLRRDHSTFEKNARWFLNHQNRDKAISYGYVPKAYYNTDLSRVELIAALNATKEAANRNGNLVAERTLNKLASNRDVDVSMSCGIPFDVCALCGHKAKHRGEYCKSASNGGCCTYGGCFSKLGTVYDDGAHQYVDNPHCNFFDISDVSDTRGADRTAFITGKVAGHYVPGGAELAELMGLVPPDHLLEPSKVAQLRCLRKLAEAVGHVRPEFIFCPQWSDRVEVRKKLAKTAAHEYMRPSSDYAAQALIADLAADGVLLPPAEWLHLTTGVARDKCASAFTHGMTPDQLLSRSDLHDLLTGTYTPRTNGVYSWLAPTTKSAGKEAMLGVVQAESNIEKVAAVTPESNEIAARYTAYQAAVLATYENSSNFPLLLVDAVRHTRTHSA